MNKSEEFSATVRGGVRAPQPDVVVHARRQSPGTDPTGPQIGLVVTKAVGNAVHRHRVARQLRHAAQTLLAELDPDDRVVIRALPSSRDAATARLAQQLHAGLKRAHQLLERGR